MAPPIPSKLDQRQILQAVLDESTGRLRTDAQATIVNADIDVSLDAAEDNVEIKSAAGVALKIETNGSINTNATQVGVYDVSSEEVQPAVSTVTSLNGSIINQTVLIANPDRKGVILYRKGTGIAYIKLGATASEASHTLEMTNNTIYELPFPCYTGRIDVVFTTNNGTLKITELT